jgi:predicted signal transduction protein with EAL and GGDEF domain
LTSRDDFAMWEAEMSKKGSYAARQKEMEREAKVRAAVEEQQNGG